MTRLVNATASIPDAAYSVQTFPLGGGFGQTDNLDGTFGNGNPKKERETRLQTAYEETQDATEVLTAGGLSPAAVPASWTRSA